MTDTQFLSIEINRIRGETIVVMSDGERMARLKAIADRYERMENSLALIFASAESQFVKDLAHAALAREVRP